MCLGSWLDYVVFHKRRFTPEGAPPGGEEDLPIGSIALWSMKNGSIPAGWKECDGTQNAPGPDLRSRFIVGRSASRTVDTSGGSSLHAHSTHSATFTHDPHAGLVKHGTTGTADVWTTPTIHANHIVDLLHSDAAHEPPFYVLVYIQRMS